ncbi:MAG: S41 family peptidase [Lachnospiraceae bacterium]|nr:S41 family peptidase [Lachnospiraceae bacterium]
MDRPEEVEVIKEENEKKNVKGFRNGILVGVLGTILILAGICAGIIGFRLFAIRGTQAGTGAKGSSIINTETLQKIQTIEAAIDNYYFYEDDVSSQDLQDGIYKGMVEALGDPYSEYYTKEELEEALNSNKGISYGIGAYISLDKQANMAIISGVMDGSPAQEAGLREGDLINEVDGESTRNLSLTQVVNLVKGREGTTVHLTIYREGEADFLEFDVIRGKLIETTTVASGILEDTDHIGYLRIQEFDDVTVDQYTEAMAVLREDGMKGLILDLRSNPGGDVNAVVEIARKILPQGLIVYTEDKYGNRKEYTCDGEHELEVPLVVLVNQYSASASELLAGAIQDYNKGTVIGTTTYGKGIVQQIHSLDDGTALKLTVSAYYTPAGRNIHGVGIEPDIELEYDYEAAQAEGIDNQVEKAIEILEGKIK